MKTNGVIKNADEMFTKYNFTDADRAAYQKLARRALLWMAGLGAYYGILGYKLIRDHFEEKRRYEKYMSTLNDDTMKEEHQS